VAGDADREVLGTLAAGLRAREANCPPLTAWGIWRAFYTPLHWLVAQEVVSDADHFRKMVKGDRAAVALGYWENASGREWQREFQGLYRGPNQWVYPTFEADPLAVADLYRVERGTPDHVLVLDYAIHAYPWVTVREPPTVPGSEFLNRWVGLDGGHGPLAQGLADGLKSDTWRFCPPERRGQVFVVRCGWRRAGTDDVSEIVMEIDSEHGCAPLAYRHTSVYEGTARAFELRWGDLREVGGVGVFLAASAVRWEFDYNHAGVPPLVNTQTFAFRQLSATDPEMPRPSVPRFAVFEDLGQVPPADQGTEQCVGDSAWALRAGFAQAEPPPPPEDLTRLTPADAVAQIKARYGFQ
jgi:hypothetical protein